MGDQPLEVFEASDLEEFTGDIVTSEVRRTMVKKINAKLARLMGPRVFLERYDSDTDDWMVSTQSSKGDTHQAFIFNITPLAKVECEHEPSSMNITNGKITFRCSKCEKKLSPTWTVSDGD